MHGVSPLPSSPPPPLPLPPASYSAVPGVKRAQVALLQETAEVGGQGEVGRKEGGIVNSSSLNCHSTC